MLRTNSPQISLSSPSPQRIERFLEGQRSCAFTYQQVGCTQTGSASGFTIDEYRQQLGHGMSTFETARTSIAKWSMFPGDWIRVLHQDEQPRTDMTVAIQIRHLGLWWLNSARVVYVIDEPGRRYGFAYGTLPGHFECGEERFLVEQDSQGTVWYDLRAMSRPGHWITRIGHPFVRRLQRHFARDSMKAMARSTNATS